MTGRPYGGGGSRLYRVGLLVAGTFVVFLALLLFVLGSSLRSDDVRYRVWFDENVKGMVVGSRVNFQGVPVGAVDDIRFEQGRTAVDIVLDARKATVQEVTQARLDRLLVTGQVTIELEGWREGSPSLEPGGTIRTRANPLQSLASDLPEAVGRIDSVLLEAERLVQSLNALLGDENRARLTHLLARVDGLADELADSVPTQVERIGDASVAAIDDWAALARDARGMVERSDAVIARVDEALVDGAMTDDVQAFVRDSRVAGAELAELVGELRRLVRVGGPTARDALVAARDALREMQAAARVLRREPRALLFGAEATDAPALPAPSRGGSR